MFLYLVKCPFFKGRGQNSLNISFVASRPYSWLFMAVIKEMEISAVEYPLGL